MIYSKWGDTKIAYNKDTEELIILDNKLPMTRSIDPKYISKKDNILRENIKHITFKHKETVLPKDASKLFKNFKNIEHLDLSYCDFKNAEKVNDFIYNTFNLKTLTFKNINNSKIYAIQSLISNAPNLHTIRLENITLKHLNIIDDLVTNAPNINRVYTKNISAPKLRYIFYLYSGYFNKNKIVLNSSLLNKCPLAIIELFKINNSKLNIDISRLNTKHLVKFNALYKSNVKSIKLPKDVADSTIMIDTSIDQIYTYDGTELSNASNLFEYLNANFLTRTYYKEPINLDIFKSLKSKTKKEPMSFNFYKSVKDNTYKHQESDLKNFKEWISNTISQKTKGVKIITGSHKDELIKYNKDENLIATLILANVHFIDVSLNELKPLLIKSLERSNYNKNALDYVKNYINTIYKDDKSSQNVLKTINILEKLNT